MNLKIFCVIPISLMAVACFDEADIKTVVCETQHIPDKCTGEGTGGDPNNPTVTIHLGGPLKVTPPHVCAKNGKKLTFKLDGNPHTPPTVVVSAKDDADEWLHGSNWPGESQFTIDIPDTAKDEYDYKVFTSTGKCLDPRVDVQ
jgi:hypothetical protein